MKYLYDLHEKDVSFTLSDIGWVVGHKLIIYGPLLRGGSTVMYEGKPIGTPNAGVIWRMVEDYGVKSVFIAPTAVRSIK
jgi:propionyl-CoA synthetase